MKQIITKLLFQRSLKTLKSEKGFSLIEVLVAVAIIGIISAIAVPQFTANRNQAARVAGDTSISNILKAFNNCMVLNSFGECNTLSLLKVTCPECDSKESTADKTFCAHIKKGKAGATPDFAACVSIDADGASYKVTRSYGGSLLTGASVCHSETADDPSTPGTNESVAKAPISPLKNCRADSECGTNGDPVRVTYDCTTSTQQGVCDNGALCT